MPCGQCKNVAYAFYKGHWAWYTLGRGKVKKLMVCTLVKIYVFFLFFFYQSRVVMQQPGERNFHSFYQFLYGSPEALMVKYNIKKDTSCYHYISQGGSPRVCFFLTVWIIALWGLLTVHWDRNQIVLYLLGDASYQLLRKRVQLCKWFWIFSKLMQTTAWDISYWLSVLFWLWLVFWCNLGEFDKWQNGLQSLFGCHEDTRYSSQRNRDCLEDHRRHSTPCMYPNIRNAPTGANILFYFSFQFVFVFLRVI